MKVVEAIIVNITEHSENIRLLTCTLFKCHYMQMRNIANYIWKDEPK